MLAKLHRKKNLVVIGLNSGTSADGLDLAAVKISFGTKVPKIKYLTGKTVPYPSDLHRQVNNAVVEDITSMDDLIRLDRDLGRFYAVQTSKFIAALKKKNIKPDLVASHGQTVRHLPGKVKSGHKKESGTLQLGHAETISAITGLVTIADFRQGDIALGGEGAPITAKAMWALFGSKKESRLVINIGGIANYFLFPKGGGANKVRAADCGPGNSLIDIIVSRYFNRRFDPGGKIASRGRISMRLLSLLTADKFIKKKYGPSTGRGRFGVRLAEKIVEYSLKLGLNKSDILATTTELTAVAISRSIDKLTDKYYIKNIYLFGGGARNNFLIERLRANLPETEFCNVSELGFEPDYLEAICYALHGAWTVRGETSALPQVTGASRAAVAGKIIQPPGK